MVKKVVGSSKRVLALVFLALIVVGWVMVNSPELFNSAVIYLVFGLVAFTVYYSEVYKRFNLVLVSSFLDKNLFIGLGVGLFFIVLSKVNSVFSLSLPGAFLSLSSVSRFIIICLVAPILEEILFRGMIYRMILKLVFKNKVFALVLQASLFSLYHLYAYGASSGVIGSFIGAFLFGLVAGLLIDFTNDLKTSIVTHIVFNTFLLASLSVVIV